MTLFSLLLLVLAAVLHALSNALIKFSRDKLAFTWWMLTASAIIDFPLIFFAGQPQPIGWLIIVISALIEAVYFITLTRAYSLGDLSQVYPIGRGSAPLFVLLWALIFLGERPTPLGVGGILIVVAGLYLVEFNFSVGLDTPAARLPITGRPLGLADRPVAFRLFLDR